MMRLKQENIFKWLDIEFFKNSNFCLTIDGIFQYGYIEYTIYGLTACLPASLPDDIHKLRCQTKHRTAAILCHNNKLISEICHLGFR